MQLLVRNKVEDFAKWYASFSADTEAAAEYGLTDPNDIFFLVNVEDMEKANQFMARPESQEIGIKSGVIDGEFHCLEALALEI